MSNIRKRFKEFFRNGYFTRVDDKHILDLYLGLNEKGQYTLEYRGDFNIKEVKGSGVIGVSQGHAPIILQATKLYQTVCILGKRCFLQKRKKWMNLPSWALLGNCIS